MNHNPKTEIKTYAPVAIPTLCRYDHFRACLESLMQCTGADKTDVIVALDYPLKKSHEDGWRKIDSYLKSIADTHGFRKLTVLRRDRNYGFGFNGNLKTLMREVFATYDRVIMSEDDNIFSKAFLDFMNRGLEKFKDDPKVFAVCGYRHLYDVEFRDNNFYMQNVDFSAWGVGMWKDRFETSNNNNTTSYWRKKGLSPRSWVRISRNGWNRLLTFIKSMRRVYALIDNTYSVYIGVNGQDVVMPRISMVRNMGWDGSGEHCDEGSDSLARQHSTQELYPGSEFEFVGSGRECYKQNHKVYVSQSYARMGAGRFFKSLLGIK